MNKRYFFISALLFLPSYGFWWASNYINYGAEGILINGFVRLLEGLPYVSKAGEVPVVLSTYFPGFYLLYYPFAKILEINTPQNIAYLVRTLMPFYYGISIILIIRFVRENFNSKFDYKIFLLGFGFFVFKEFEGIFVFKPDMVSVFLEIFGLLFGLRGLRNKRSKDFCWSGFIFALAAIIKLNTVGMGIGFAIALLSLGYWSQFLLFSTVGLVTLTAGVGGTALYLGWDIFISVLEVTRTDLIQTQHFGAALNRVLLLVGFPYALVGLLSILATEQSEVWEKTEKTSHPLFTSSFVTSSYHWAI